MIEAYITLCYGLAYIVTILVPIQAFLVQEYAVLHRMCVYGELCTALELHSLQAASHCHRSRQEETDSCHRWTRGQECLGLRSR